MEKNEKMLSSAPYHQLLLKLSGPAIVIMIVMLVYNMADTFFIGQTGDANKIAAISICGPLFSVLSGLGTLFGNGGCTSISLALGKGDKSRMQAISSVCFAGSMLVGVVFMATVLILLEPACYLLGADADTIGFACGYLRIIALGAPFIMFSTVFACIVRADGAAYVSMYGNGLGTMVNILLDALFILGFHWGVEGAALATVIGNCVSCIYLFCYIMREQTALSFHPKHLRIEPDIVLPVLTLGLPMACSTLLMSFSHTLSNRLMMGYSPTALTAQGIAGKVGMLISMLIMGICMGLQPAISYNFSAGEYSRMYDRLKKTGILSVCAGSALAVICFFARDTIITAFIDDPTVVAYGRVMVFASIIMGPFYGIHQICQTFLQSTGKASYAILLSLLDKGIFFIPCLYLMEHFWGKYGIAFSQAVTLLLSLAVSILLALRWNREIRCNTVDQMRLYSEQAVE